MTTQTQARERAKARVRAKVFGTAERPRLRVTITNKNVTAQIIDDVKGHTLAYVTTVKAAEAKGSMTQKAAWAGSALAEKAKSAKISKVVFDRGGKIYHGRLAALATAARDKGLDF